MTSNVWNSLVRQGTTRGWDYITKCVKLPSKIGRNKRMEWQHMCDVMSQSGRWKLWYCNTSLHAAPMESKELQSRCRHCPLMSTQRTPYRTKGSTCRGWMTSPNTQRPRLLQWVAYQSQLLSSWGATAHGLLMLLLHILKYLLIVDCLVLDNDAHQKKRNQKDEFL